MKTTLTVLLFLLSLAHIQSFAAEQWQDRDKIRDQSQGNNETVAPVKHRLHDKKITQPVRNHEWYLKQITESEQFKAIALENEGANSSMVDHLVQQAATPNYPSVKTESVFKKDPSKFTFVFVPAFLNHKLMDLQNRPDMYPAFTMMWKE